MRSRGDRSVRRVAVEGLLRGIAMAALVLALGASWWRARAERGGEVEAIHVQVEGMLSAVARDSLGALARAGSVRGAQGARDVQGSARAGAGTSPTRAVTWSGTVPALMAVAEPLPEPGERWRIAAVGTGALVVEDSLGVVDSLDAPGGVLVTDALRGSARVRDGTAIATAHPTYRANAARVLVLGRAGWESRFAMTALEEAGWALDARLALGRERDVVQGDPVPRLGRHAAVIVFDSSSLRREGAAIARYVREGGGLILAGDAVAANVPGVQGMVGARVIRREGPQVLGFEGAVWMRAVPAAVLGAVRDDAVIVEQRDASPVVVARRVGAGRVLQVGYGDTWRWRMEGEGEAPAAHRAYWSQLVGSVAASGRVPLATVPVVVPAPTAALVHALGAPSAPGLAARQRRPELPVWVGVLILIALLAEWGSRRARGAV